MNQYLLKIAKNIKDRDPDKDLKTIAGLAGIVGGGKMVNHAYHSGGLTGRKTYFHGTTPEIADKIVEEGIKPGLSEGDSHWFEKNKKIDLKTGKYTFVTPNYRAAASYATRARKMANGEQIFNMTDMVGTSIEATIDGLLHPFSKKPGIVRLDIPLKGHGLHKSKDPYLRYASRTTRATEPFDFRPKWIKERERRETRRHLYKDLYKDNFVVKGEIPTKFIRDSKFYKPNSVKEIINHIKTNPKALSKSLAGVLGGTALAGTGAYILKKIYGRKENNNSGSTVHKEHASNTSSKR